MATNEIGRELKASELVPRTVVILEKPGHPFVTWWVLHVFPDYVVFTSGVLRGYFVAHRTGPDLEEITDDTGRPMKVYEYLGEV
jgi:hypothetical protein